ncbi:hypothetical protein PK28_17760 (plasmid) [Hymenobacter sp. DG25B]|nr:hypothetical protein PK28_17760 [Hymenobacter sp. DG25B]
MGTVGVLPDRNYAWERIRTDTTLAFQAADSLRLAQDHRFWLKLTVRNPSRYTAAVQLNVLPNLDNTLFYFDEDARTWRTRRAGVAVVTDSQRVKGPLRLLLPGQSTTPVYVLIRLNQRAALPPAIRLQVKLENEAEARSRDAFFRIAWTVSMAVLGLLLLTNLPTYIRFRDRTTLYYLCTQVGAMLYITAFRAILRWCGPRRFSANWYWPLGRAMVTRSTTY